MQVIYDKDPGYTSLGILTGLALGNMLQSYERRQALKVAEEAKARQDAYNIRQQMQDYSQLLNNYNNQKQAATDNIQKWADIYNNASSTDDQRQDAASHLNDMLKTYGAGINASSPDAWTQMKDNITNGSAQYLQQYKTPLTQKAQELGGAVYKEGDADRYNAVNNYLTNKRNMALNYKNAMKGKRVSDGTFQYYADYMGDGQENNYQLPQATPMDVNLNTNVLPQYVNKNGGK